MEVILRQRVEKLGDVGDIVQVKRGFARNYLVPKGLAVEATPGNIRILEEQKRLMAIREKKAAQEAAVLSEKLAKVKLTVPVQVGKEERMFGSVTAITIADRLKKEGFDVGKKSVLLEEPIKSLGVYNIPVKLHQDVQTEVKVYVIKE